MATQSDHASWKDQVGKNRSWHRNGVAVRSHRTTVLIRNLPYCKGLKILLSRLFFYISVSVTNSHSLLAIRDSLTYSQATTESTSSGDLFSTGQLPSSLTSHPAAVEAATQAVRLPLLRQQADQPSGQA